MQKQLADLQRDTDLFASTETEAQAKERINQLQREYLDLYKQTSAEMEIQRAKAEYMAGLAKENTIASGFMAGMQDIADGVTSTFTHIRTLTVDTFTSMQSTMSNVFFDFFSGELDSAKDYFAAFGQSILQAFSDMLAKMLAEYITTTMTMKAVGGMFSSIFSALGGFAAGATTTQLGGVSAGQAVTLTAANGGVFPGGFQAFAGGGIVNKPTLGLVGEGRYNEAVVPLPDGRSIPVNMRGGGTSVVVNVIDNTGGEVKKSVNKEMDEQGNMVIDIVLDALARNRKGARSQFKTALGVA
jgi:lambda family phage tail tape measure protein